MTKSILKATWQHSRNLGVFVPIYKSILLILKQFKQEHPMDSFLAGLVGGWIVFGEDTPINQQIVMYLFSRVSIGIARLAVDNGLYAPEKSFSIFAAVTWGSFGN
jgi:peroxisomal membrane protein 4